MHKEQERKVCEGGGGVSGIMRMVDAGEVGCSPGRKDNAGGV